MEYFTPEIEDIRVGYECEINKSLFAGISEGWQKFVFIKFEQLDIVNINGLKAFRVPHLTKEQIEAEGWEYIAATDLEATKYIKDKYYIRMLGDNRLNIRIDMKDGPHIMIYQGECKDINTFRYICKLLGI